MSLVKIGKYMGVCVCRRSYLLWRLVRTVPKGIRPKTGSKFEAASGEAKGEETTYILHPKSGGSMAYIQCSVTLARRVGIVPADSFVDSFIIGKFEGTIWWEKTVWSRVRYANIGPQRHHPGCACACKITCTCV